MLFVDSSAEWYGDLQGIMLDPADGSFFKLEAWWNPDVSGVVSAAFETSIMQELGKISNIKEESYQWDVIV